MGAAPVILMAIAVSGVAAYLLLALVATRVSAADYVPFGVFWAALFLIVAGLSGVQQEIVRATGPRRAEPARTASASIFAVCALVTVAAIIAMSSPLWVVPVFGIAGWHFVTPLAVGAGGYVIVAVVSGTLYGLEAWRTIAVIIAGEGVVRLAAIVLVLSLGQSTVALAWAVALPFGLTLVLCWFLIRRDARGKSELDVGYRRLSWNVARTVGASIAAGLLASGFPIILKLTSPNESDSAFGALIFAVTLVRAPLVVVYLAMQSYMVVAFGVRGRGATRFLVKIIGGAVALTMVLSAVAGFVVPQVFFWFRHDYAIDGWVLAGLVSTSGVLAALTATGALILSRARHGLYGAGWIVAAIMTVGILIVVPGLIEIRMLASLALGPAFGVAVHLIGLKTGAKHEL